MLNRWSALVYYCNDGQAEIDNMPAERALRGVALGRRNYLFAGSDAGGERAAAMYSLIGSARLNGVDPEAYLHYVIERIADHQANRIDELLPWNVAPNLPATAGNRSHRARPIAVKSFSDGTDSVLTPVMIELDGKRVVVPMRYQC